MDKSISARLKMLRAKSKLNQKLFAEQFGISGPTFSAYETGSNCPPLPFLMAIKEKYRVSLDWLCGSTDCMHGSIAETYAGLVGQLREYLSMNILGLIDNPDKFGDAQYLSFNDSILRDFFSEWHQMLALRNKGTINDDLLALWLDQQLEKLDRPIERPTEE